MGACLLSAQCEKLNGNDAVENFERQVNFAICNRCSCGKTSWEHGYCGMEQALWVQTTRGDESTDSPCRLSAASGASPSVQDLMQHLVAVDVDATGALEPEDVPHDE